MEIAVLSPSKLTKLSRYIWKLAFLYIITNPIDKLCFRSKFNLYGADEFGWVRGEEQMMAELSRGPIACSINSHPDEFKHYSGGIITCDDEEVCKGILTHIVVIAGYGVDKATGTKYWVGRNSYGTQVCIQYTAAFNSD
jgi:hypothetical protein